MRKSQVDNRACGAGRGAILSSCWMALRESWVMWKVSSGRLCSGGLSRTLCVWGGEYFLSRQKVRRETLEAIAWGNCKKGSQRRLASLRFVDGQELFRGIRVVVNKQQKRKYIKHAIILSGFIYKDHSVFIMYGIVL